MSLKRSGLGKNLSALLSTSPSPFLINNMAPVMDEILRLDVQSLQPGQYQPRTAMDDASLQELASSIKQQGLLQPLLVRSLKSGGYEIIAGERRWRACQLAGLTQVPVLLRQVDDETAMAMALVENLQREDLNPMDQARAMARLSSEFDLTHQQIAELLCKSRAAVSNFLRLLSLSSEVMTLLENGDLDMGHARALLMLDKEQQMQVATLVIAKNLSVRETEKLVNRVKEGHAPVSQHEDKEPLHRCFNDYLQHLGQHLNTHVKLKQGRAGKGTLVIHYSSANDLEAVIKQILG